MKQWITLIAATAIFTSCSKQDMQEDLMQTKASIQSSTRATSNGAYISNWEQYTNWTKVDDKDVSRFTMKRKTPEITSEVTDGGLVISYGKVSTSDPRYASFTSPKMVPYYYLPEAERPIGNTNYFSDETSLGNVAVTYSVPATKDDMPTMGGGIGLSDYQFQYVVMTKMFLQSHGLSAEQVRNYYTYDQVINLASK